MDFFNDKIAIRVLGKLYYAVRIAEEAYIASLVYPYQFEKPVQFHVALFLIKIHVKNTEVAIQYSSAVVEQM